MMRPARSGPGLLALVCALALPGVAAANRLAYDCTPATGPGAAAAFDIELQAGGSIKVFVPGGHIPGVTASRNGPFAWTLDTTLNTLTVEGRAANGRTLVLWHRIDMAQAAVPPVGTLTQLYCETS